MEELVEIFESYELAAGQPWSGRIHGRQAGCPTSARRRTADEEQGGSGEDPQLPVAAEVVGDAIEQTWFLAVGSRFHRHGPCSNALRCLCTHVGLQFRMIAREQKMRGPAAVTGEKRTRVMDPRGITWLLGVLVVPLLPNLDVGVEAEGRFGHLLHVGIPFLVDAALLDPLRDLVVRVVGDGGVVVFARVLESSVFGRT